jgi:hypothetical protein
MNGEPNVRVVLKGIHKVKMRLATGDPRRGEHQGWNALLH